MVDGVEYDVLRVLTLGKASGDKAAEGERDQAVYGPAVCDDALVPADELGYFGSGSTPQHRSAPTAQLSIAAPAVTAASRSGRASDPFKRFATRS